MKVEFEIRILDVLVVHAFHAIYNKAQLVTLLLVTLAFTFKVLSYGAAVFAIEFAIRFLIIAVLGVLFMTLLTMTVPSMRNGRVGKHTVEVDELGLRESTDQNDTKHTWQSISHVRVTRNYLLFLMGGNGMCVPRPKGISGEEWQAFTSAVLARAAG